MQKNKIMKSDVILVRPSYILQRAIKTNIKEKVIWWFSVIMMGVRLLISSYNKE